MNFSTPQTLWFVETKMATLDMFRRSHGKWIICMEIDIRNSCKHAVSDDCGFVFVSDSCTALLLSCGLSFSGFTYFYIIHTTIVNEYWVSMLLLLQSLYVCMCEIVIVKLSYQKKCDCCLRLSFSWSLPQYVQYDFTPLQQKSNHRQLNFLKTNFLYVLHTPHTHRRTLSHHP